VSALVSELPRVNGWSIARQGGDRTPDQTQRLLNHASWDTFAAMGVVRRFAARGLEEAARRGRRGGMVIGAIDETGQEKASQAVGRGLLIGRLIHDQYRVPVIEVPRRPCRRDVQNLLVVPDRARQEVLQPVRPAVPGCLGDRPAVVIVQLYQQPAYHLAAGLPGLPPGKAPGHLPQQVR